MPLRIRPDLSHFTRLVLLGTMLPGLVSCAGDGGYEPAVTGPPVTAGPGTARLHQSVTPAIVPGERSDRYFEQLSRRLTTAARDVARDRNGPLASTRVGGEWFAADAITPRVVASPLVNVYSAGGPHVYVYTGLLQRCAVEDDLAAVLAHEYAHLVLGHSAPRAAAATGEDPVPAMALRLADVVYDPSQELRADDVAFAIYVRGGWDPVRYPAVWDATGGPGAARMSAVREKLERLPPVAGEWVRPPIADERWFGQFKRETLAAGGTAPNDAARRVLAALPSAFTGTTADQVAARRELQRELAPPPAPAPVVNTGPGTGTPSSPTPFERGPRGR